MERLLTGEELEQAYYNGNLDLTTLSIEDLIVLSDYLGETEINDKQLALLEKCLDQIGTFDEYKLNSDALTKENTWNNVLLKFDQSNSSIKYIRKTHKFGKLLVSIIAAIVSVFGISTVVCNARGINLFDFILNKQTGIVSNNKTSSVDIISKDYCDYEEFRNNNIDAIVPKYTPNGYEFKSASSYINEDQEQYTIVFQNNNFTLKFKQTIYLDDNTSISVENETDGECIETYTLNGVNWDIYSNNKKNTAICVYNNNQYIINTFENIDELKNIISSIYESE